MVIPTIDEMKAELIKAGWKPWKKHFTIWKSPDGLLYRGPYKAWKIMKFLNQH